MRRILVRLSGEAVDGETLKTARALAQRFGARLDGVFVRPKTASILLEASPVAALTAVIGGEKVSQLDPQEDRQEASARTTFDTGQSGAAGAWRVLTGRSALALDAALADVLVQTGTWRDPDPASDDLFHVLGDSQVPILLPAPDGGGLDLSVVAVAWEAALPSVRALAAATPLLGAAGAIVVLHDRAGDPADLQPVREHLELHGLAARFEGLDFSSKKPADAVAERCADLKAGLLVMGAYAHSHLTESLFGGFTQDMLAERRFAVLLRH
jgi:nucleotide-binding universal stress UspA family protein